MLESPSALLTMLVLTHVVVDFSLPFKRTMTATLLGKRLPELIGLAIVHGLVVTLTLALARNTFTTTGWVAGAAVALSWLLISGAAVRWFSPSIRRLMIEHSLHILVLLAVWLTSEGYWEKGPGFINELLATRNLVLVLAYLLILRPASAVIGSALAPWLSQAANQDSLKNAGAPIGYLERLLILTFVLLKQWEAVGFLLTAKSILRFPEIQQQSRQISEYVLLGTLMSFALSIGVGLFTLYARGDL